MRLRSKTTSGALLFGSALDRALNTLLTSKNYEEAKAMFEKAFRFQEINNVGTYLPYATNVVYAQKDYDGDLIFEEDEKKFQEQYKTKFNLDTDKSLKQLTAFYRELKKEKGFQGLTEDQKRVYNYGHWICLKNKGLILLEGYNKEIVPRIKNVIEVQKHISLENQEGDKITGWVDAILEMDDGKRYIIDHKTSSMEYEDDSAMRSQQLILYYHITKDEYKIDGVGFIVLYKQLDKNKKKVCEKCGFNGSGGRHKTCPNEVDGPDGLVERCNGMWKETIDPVGRIQVILNTVSEQAENLVMSVFDEANDGIKKNVFNPNLSACGDGDWRCAFYKKCWYGSDEDLIVLENKNDR